MNRVSRAMLITKNEDVDYLSNIVIEKLLFEFLNSINISGLPPHELKLTIAAPIMLLRNLDHRNGHCNGTRCTIVTATNHLLTARIVTSVYVEDIVLIRRFAPSFHITKTSIPFKASLCCYVHQ